MSVIITILFLFLFFSGMIWIIIRGKQVSLQKWQVIVFFGCKIVAGSLYGYIYKRFYNGDDTWWLNHDSYFQYNRLVHTPGLFLRDIFTARPIGIDANTYLSSTSYFENLEYAFFTKGMAPFNFISHGNYYINIVFFNFLTFWGLYFLYKLLAVNFLCKKGITAAIIFLFPPVVFWISGLRAEGLLVLFTGILLYYFNQYLNRPRPGNILLCLISFALIFVFRSGFGLLLLPPLVGWWLAVRFKIKSHKAFGGVYATVTAIIIICASFLLPPFNPLSVVVRKQQDFLALHGNTRFNLTPLQDNTWSFLKVLPEAFANTLIRPFLWEAKGFLQWPAAIENMIIWFLVLLAAIKYPRYTRALLLNPFAWVLLCASFSSYLLIGYTVPFPGAIVRYRIIAEFFLVCVSVAAIAKGVEDGKRNLRG